MGAAYLIVLALGFARHGFDEPIADPILAVMELLTLSSVLPLVSIAVAVMLVAPDGRRVWGILAVCFVAMFAVATSGVHVFELTVGRQLGTPGLVWPSASYAIELLAWDLFLGLSLLFVAGALDPRLAPRWLRRVTQLAGALCLAGIIGPATGDMRLQFIGVLGYAVLLPLVALGLARWFHVTAAARP